MAVPAAAASLTMVPSTTDATRRVNRRRSPGDDDRSGGTVLEPGLSAYAPARARGLKLDDLAADSDRTGIDTEGGMGDRERLEKLRALRDQLTRLPPSEERDRMLREVGSRTVDLESSEPRAPVRPRGAKPDVTVDPPPAQVVPDHAPRRPRRRPARPPRTTTRGAAGRARSRADAADAFIASVRPTPELPEGLMLSLDDDVETHRERPWTRGLRG